MPDCQNSTLPRPSIPARNADMPETAVSTCPRTAAALLDAVSDLESIQSRLLAAAATLPAPQEGAFVAAAELRGIIDCVVRDLIEDALETLLAASLKTEEQLRRDYRDRQRWLARPVRMVSGGGP